jgi:hypothetical protein
VTRSIENATGLLAQAKHVEPAIFAAYESLKSIMTGAERNQFVLNPT